MSLPLSHFPYSSNIPLFFSPCVYTQEYESEDTLLGRGKGFSLSDPSLPFTVPFAQSFLASPFPFCVSLIPPFPSTCSFSLNLYWLFIGQLLQVHWYCKMKKGTITLEFLSIFSQCNVMYFLYNFLFQGLPKEDVSGFYPSLFLS